MPIKTRVEWFLSNNNRIVYGRYTQQQGDICIYFYGDNPFINGTLRYDINRTEIVQMVCKDPIYADRFRNRSRHID